MELCAAEARIEFKKRSPISSTNNSDYHLISLVNSFKEEGERTASSKKLTFETFLKQYIPITKSMWLGLLLCVTFMLIFAKHLFYRAYVI